MKRRLSALAAGLIIGLGLSSCLEVEQTLTLKKDGSGTITEEIVMGAQMVAMMQMAAAQGGEAPDPMAEMMDEAQYKEKAAKYGEGVEFVKVEKVERNGGMGAKAHYKFADVNKIAFSPGSAMDSMNMGEAEGGAEEKVNEKPLDLKYTDGKLTITYPDPPEDLEVPADDGEDGDLGPEAQQMMAMFKDMKVSVNIVAEPGIAATNATYVDGDKVTVMEMNFGEIMENPEGMKVLSKLDTPDRDKMAAALKGIKGVKIETKKTVEVTLK